ncbi:serine/threonine-protein phosphatase 2A 55 kDa regulatory subunit B delta isoform isoform X2 [Pteropus vampyrus]|uniref:Serine/threonine-protein phosphatase 2A 55 kDa regulatory subunit B delta isoform isoform X2 n=1 Tax=Pteropus vampyrus TaxID=132908 RepID=A0A6P6D2I9_PTEVA|nr:serine/threonine-protein phosphatase 2A 55 kDa regulatory subunit B delta isoform isoform X2 [Pteropus vampyrus]
MTKAAVNSCAHAFSTSRDERRERNRRLACYIISTVELNHFGDLLATGDKGGGVVIFQWNKRSQHRRPQTSWRKPVANAHAHPGLKPWPLHPLYSLEPWHL